MLDLVVRSLSYASLPSIIVVSVGLLFGKGILGIGSISLLTKSPWFQKYTKHWANSGILLFCCLRQEMSPL